MRVRGTEDWIKQYKKYEYIIDIFKKTAIKYGFSLAETSILEFASLFNKSVGTDSDIVSKEMFYAQSAYKNDFDTVLRPEGTTSIIRACIDQGVIHEKPLRLAYVGPMFRYNRPQFGRLRQFHQMGCEILNDDEYISDVEMIIMLFEIFEKLQISTNLIKLHIYTLGNVEALSKYIPIITSYLHENQHFLSELNKQRLQGNIMRILDQLSATEKANLADMPKLLDVLSNEEVLRFENICNLLQKLNISFVIDPFMVRGLDYYHHTVFEILYKEQAIAGGGCYDNLVEKLGGPSIKGKGWAIGLERILPLCQINIEQQQDLLVIVSIDTPEESLILAQKLRNQYSVLIIYDNMKKAIKRLNKIKPKYVVFYELQEVKNNKYEIKQWS